MTVQRFNSSVGKTPVSDINGIDREAIRIDELDVAGTGTNHDSFDIGIRMRKCHGPCRGHLQVRNHQAASGRGDVRTVE